MWYTEKLMGENKVTVSHTQGEKESLAQQTDGASNRRGCFYLFALYLFVLEIEPRTFTLCATPSLIYLSIYFHSCLQVHEGFYRCHTVTSHDF